MVKFGGEIKNGDTKKHEEGHTATNNNREIHGVRTQTITNKYLCECDIPPMGCDTFELTRAEIGCVNKSKYGDDDEYLH